MLNNEDYKLGSIIKLKKPHPSGTIEWEIIRVGADIKIQSTIEKSLFIMMSRRDFNRKAVEVVKL